MKLLSAVILFASFVLLVGSAQAVVTVTSNQLYVYTAGDVGVEDYFLGTTIPTHTAVNVTDGISHSNNNIDWDVIAGQTVFSFDIDHRRTGEAASTVWTRSETLKFTVDTDQPYEASGFYNVTNLDTSGTGVVQMQASLSDSTGSEPGFNSGQLSGNTHNEQFVLGGLGGDDSGGSSFGGSLTGNLIAGHVYEFSFNYMIATIPNIDAGATALGNITLKIGTAVPEPSTLLLLSIGAISLLGRRKAKS